MALRQVRLVAGADLDGFRRAVRALVAAGVPPEEVDWIAADETSLFGDALPPDAPPLSLPRPVGELIRAAVPHRDPERYGLLYGVIWRVLHGERDLLEVASDPAVHRLEIMRKSVKRDIHKMHAYLRFRGVGGVQDPGPERYAAWFEPDHFILEAAVPFFAERFRAMIWTIVTPIGSAHWDRERVSFGPPGTRADVPVADAFEEGWTGYYAATFNPARANPKLMQQHMAKKYWRNMPEAAAIPALIRSASSRVDAMLEGEPTVPLKRKPEGALAAMLDQAPASLAELNAIIRAAGPLVPGATQAVVGEGPERAGIVFVGEQPGDEEDLTGRPFVGPAGRLLDRAMAEAGIDRKDVYLTNAVKHFKFEQRGKRRIHAKPTAGEVSHYRWWLMRELELIEPRLVVALGGTAVLALTGKSVPITRARGPTELLEHFAGYITVHPSYLLRLPDEDAKRSAYAAFVGDLQRVRALGEASAPRRTRAA
ncbi:MAG: uracil-DNA glycosylase [Enterovirga sp.]|nr:uracil-DNA glycosylase [Enterovirga sp.]